MGLRRTGSGLLVSTAAEPEAIWECPFCDVTYGKGDDRAIARHIDVHDDEIGEALEVRLSEPLREHDAEALKWLREKALRERDTTVKGVN